MKQKRKNTIIMLMSFAYTLEKYLEDMKNEDVQKHKKEVALARTWANKAALAMTEDAYREDIKDADRLLNYLKNVECVIKPRSVSSSDDYIYIDREVLNRLLMPTLMQCSICGETKQYAAQCQTKKDLDHCGIVEKSGLSCPYQF